MSDKRLPTEARDKRPALKSVIAVLACLVSASLIACSGPAVPTTATVAQSLQALQAKGALPTLDVTTSLTGTDANSNGVRDDIDKYIASLPDTAAEQKALTQMAQAVQATMTVDTTSATALSAASLNIQRGVTCLWQAYPVPTAHNRVILMEEISANTFARLQAYEKYNAARNGAVLPALTGSTCN